MIRFFKNRQATVGDILNRAIEISACIGFLLLFSNCDSFVEVDIPSVQLPAAQVFEEAGTADAAMSDVYSKMRDAGILSGSPTGYSYALGLYTDELDHYAGTEDAGFEFYSNSILAQSPRIQLFWSSAYSQIYAANSVIYGVENSISLAQENRNRLRGEALFVRALLHSMMAATFGNIPYVTTTNYQQNSTIGKRSVTEVLQLAKADLVEALPLLPEAYTAIDRTRPNSGAVNALLARICLYLGEWEQAADYASGVLDATALYGLDENFESTFLNSSKGTIFQFSPSLSSGNTLEAITFTFDSGPPPSIALSQDIIESFEPDDLRRQQWIRAIEEGSNTFYHVYKYKENTAGAAQSEFSKVLRIGETYLIRAEARARLGLLGGAADDLNGIRNFAGLPDTPAVSQQEMLTAVLQERRVELFCEFGHRFTDLKRFGVLDAVLGAAKSGWNAHDILFPIPQSELLLNQNLNPQNSGY